MVPNRFQQHVGHDSSDCHYPEPFHYLIYLLLRVPVLHIFLGALVDELQHLMRGDVVVSVRDLPAKLLVVQLALGF